MLRISPPLPRSAGTASPDTEPDVAIGAIGYGYAVFEAGVYIGFITDDHALAAQESGEIDRAAIVSTGAQTCTCDDSEKDHEFVTVLSSEDDNQLEEWRCTSCGKHWQRCATFAEVDREREAEQLNNYAPYRIADQS